MTHFLVELEKVQREVEKLKKREADQKKIADETAAANIRKLKKNKKETLEVVVIRDDSPLPPSPLTLQRQEAEKKMKQIT